MLNALKQIRAAASRLTPHEIVQQADRPLVVGLVASNNAGHAEMEEFLLSTDMPAEKRMDLLKLLHREGEAGSPDRFNLVLCEQGLPCPVHAFTWFRDDPQRTVEEILRERGELALALARLFAPFRKPVVDRVIQAVARENALFAVVTALPNVVPSLIELPWAVGEFASDTAFLTINQIRMAFLIAAASDREVGYLEQKGQLAGIIGGAFGWRAVARELAGKIPLGGGLIPKGAIAYAGTYVVGKSLERLHRHGRAYSRAERQDAFDSAFDKGRAVVEVLLGALKKHSLA